MRDSDIDNIETGIVRLLHIVRRFDWPALNSPIAIPIMFTTVRQERLGVKETHTRPSVYNALVYILYQVTPQGATVLSTTVAIIVR